MTYHAVVDLFVLGVLWALYDAAKRKLMRDPELAQAIRKLFGGAFLVFLVCWLASALYFRPWKPIDIPLWLLENLVRVLDFPDAMDSYDIHWHQVPKEWWESTLTFVCRIWIALGLGLLKAHLFRKQPTGESPSVGRVARLAFVVVLFGCFVGLPKLLPVNPADNATALAAVAGEPDDTRSTAALNALSRMGPNAETAVEPLAALLPKSTVDRRRRILDTLGHLGPKAVDLLRDVALDGDASEAEVAVASLRRIGPKTAPTLAAVWRETRNERVKAATDAALRHFGLEAMPTLIEATTTSNASVHFYWFNELDRNWALRGTDNRTVLALQKLQATREPAKVRRFGGDLTDKEWSVCVAAAEELGRIGPSATPALVEALADKDWDVRWVVAMALGQIGPSAKDAVPALVNALADNNRYVRRAAAWALGKIGPSAKDAVPALVEALADQDKDVRVAAAEALGKIGPGAKDAVPALVKALADKHEHVRSSAIQAAIKAFGGIGPSDKDAVPALVKALADQDKDVRVAAAKALGRIGPSAKDAVPALAKALALDVYVRSAAAEALRWIDSTWQKSESAKDAVPALVKALADEDVDVRQAAAGALGRIGPSAKDAVPALVKALADQGIYVPKAIAKDDVRRAAIEALGQIGPSAKDAVPALVNALADRVWEVRSAAAKALGKIGPDAKEALPVLEKMARSDVYQFSESARVAIEKIRGK